MIQKPKNLTTPFANAGAKNDIPVPPYTEPGNINKASWSAGFPPVTMMPIEAGGIPPEGMDMNGVLNEISAHTVYQNAGGVYAFDTDYCTAIGGYPKGAVLMDDEGANSYVSLVDNNTENFNTADPVTQWEMFAGKDKTGIPPGGENLQLLQRTANGYRWVDPNQVVGVKQVNVASTAFSSQSGVYVYTYPKTTANERFIGAYEDGNNILVDTEDSNTDIKIKALAAFNGYILISY